MAAALLEDAEVPETSRLHPLLEDAKVPETSCTALTGRDALSQTQQLSAVANQ